MLCTFAPCLTQELLLLLLLGPCQALSFVHYGPGSGLAACPGARHGPCLYAPRHLTIDHPQMWHALQSVRGFIASPRNPASVCSELVWNAGGGADARDAREWCSHEAEGAEGAEGAHIHTQCWSKGTTVIVVLQWADVSMDGVRVAVALTF
jgi:hypothetical protein